MYKYIAIEFSNVYTNKFRDIRDIYNNELMHNVLPYFSNKPNKYNEYPIWLAHVNGILDGNLRAKLVDSIDEAIDFIVESKPEYVFFSELEVTSKAIHTITWDARCEGVKFIIGRKSNKTYPPSVINIDSIEGLNETFNLNKKYRPIIPEGIVYDKHLAGRLNITRNCNFNCKFCINNRGVKKLSQTEISDQYAILDNKYIYVGDLTFGQENEYETNCLYGKRDKHQFIIQTNAKTVLSLPVRSLSEWYSCGIRCAELGVETFDDSVLSYYNKPSTVMDNLQAIRELNVVGIKVIPNIMVGFEIEKPSMYDANIEYLQDLISEGYIYYLNIFFFADYKSDNSNDRSELKLIKSWHKTPNDRYKLEEYVNKLYKLNYYLLKKIRNG